MKISMADCKIMLKGFKSGKAAAPGFINDKDTNNDLKIRIVYLRDRACSLKSTGALLNSSYFNGVASGLQEIVARGYVTRESSSYAIYGDDERLWPTLAAHGHVYSDVGRRIQRTSGCCFAAERI